MVHDRRRPEGKGGPCLLGVLYSAENEERKGDRRVPQRRGLAYARNCETFAARTGQRARHAYRSVAVGIGFHHSDHGPVSGKTPCEGVVRDQGTEIDARDKTAGELHRPGL
jgi:hypothetical protein